MKGVVYKLLWPAVAFLVFTATSWAGLAPKPTVTYEQGTACYERLTADRNVRKNQARWKECIAIFELVAESQRGSSTGARATYSAARLSKEMQVNTGSEGGLQRALTHYNRVVSDYGSSNLADDALFQIAVLRMRMNERVRAQNALRALLERYPRSDSAPKARAMLDDMEGKRTSAADVESTPSEPRGYERPTAAASKEDRSREPGWWPERKDRSGHAPPPVEYSDKPASSKEPAILVGVDHVQEGDNTVVTLSFNRPVEYRSTFESGRRRRDASSSLEVMLKETHPLVGLTKSIRINSPAVRRVRVKPRILGGTVVDFDLHKGTVYTIRDFRRSLDVVFTQESTHDQTNPRAAPISVLAHPSSTPKEAGKSSSGFSLRKLKFWDRKKSGETPLRIVIDPGHGGDEKGAIGPHGIMEKDIVLDVSRKLASQLEARLGARVYLTRKKDKTVSLKKRYKYARRKKADIFISVHANASENPHHSGIETYYLDNATDEAAIRLAARENESWRGSKSDIDRVLATMLQNALTDESRELASDVQDSLYQQLRVRYTGVKNRSARSALFYVLVGTQCPSILVESSFITNPREEMRLADPTYQQQIASAITNGIKSYMATQSTRHSTL